MTNKRVMVRWHIDSGRLQKRSTLASSSRSVDFVEHADRVRLEIYKNRNLSDLKSVGIEIHTGIA